MIEKAVRVLNLAYWLFLFVAVVVAVANGVAEIRAIICLLPLVLYLPSGFALFRRRRWAR